MAYANLISQLCITNYEAFKRARDFICRRDGTYDYSTTGIGWTLHDAVYASSNEDMVSDNDYFVVYSTGEDGGQNIYLKFLISGNYIVINAYLYWNSTTHAGTGGTGVLNNWALTANSLGTIWIYGDRDSLTCVSKYSTSYYLATAGHCPGSRFATTVATSAYAVAAGSNRTITVDAVPEGFVVGRKVFIRDNANIELTTISDITGNVITVTSVAASYSAGCKLQGDVSYYSQNGTVPFTVAAVISHTGNKAVLHSKEAFAVAPTTYADALDYDKYPMNCAYASGTNSMIGPFKNAYLINGYNLISESVVGSYRVFYIGTVYIAVKEV